MCQTFLKSTVIPSDLRNGAHLNGVPERWGDWTERNGARNTYFKQWALIFERRSFRAHENLYNFVIFQDTEEQDHSKWREFPAFYN